MGESHHHHQFLHQQQQQQNQNQNQNQNQSRMAVRSATGGEIVEVQGGHIVRSTGRKDRHSKVCTAKGPRDRRVRLSAHTAIKFYDVQDRLGYDRPSKAVDWLIKNAKPAIDELDELPPWQPTNSTHPAHAHQVFDIGAEPENQPNTQNQQLGQSGSGKKPVESEQFQLPPPFQGNSSFLPPSLDSDAIADTIKSFFPMPSSSSSTSSIHFQNQDLRLSLHPFHDPILSHHQHHHQPTPSGEQALFTGSAPMAFDAGSASWSEQQQQEMGRFQRMIAWNAAESGSGGGGGGGYVFSAASPVPLQPLLGQNAFFTQRGPLQSSNSPAVRAWTDFSSIAADHQTPPTFFHPSASSISAIGYASGGFSGFRIPARIQGEEEQDAVGNKPSTSASSASRH